jgi:hypothetical protein
MKEIAIHDIRDGMKLAADVADEGGQVLLAAGRSLSATHIQLLERRGILTVKVADPDEAAAAPGGAPSKEELEGALKKLEHMFEGFEGDAIMKAIHASARGMLEHALPGRR